MKIIIILLVVAAVIAGLLLTLRTSRNTGMPSEDVIKRAQERTRAEDARENND
jgi:flagellar basal body-associated protein FliL